MMMAASSTTCHGHFVVGMRVALDLNFRNSTIASVAMVKGLYHHTNGDIGLLEDVKVIAI